MVRRAELDERADAMLLKRELGAASRRVRHPELPLHLFVVALADDDELLDEDGSEWVVPEHDREAAHARHGALIAAVEEVIDRCIDDLQYLDFEPDGLPNPDEADDSFVCAYFPERHRAAYNERFFRNVLVCAIKVAQDLGDPHGGRAACTAEEIIRNAVAERALTLCDHAGVGPPALEPTEFLLEDADFEYLNATRTWTASRTIKYCKPVWESTCPESMTGSHPSTTIGSFIPTRRPNQRRATACTTFAAD